MLALRRLLTGIIAAALLPSALGGCYLYSGESFENWPEVRMARPGGGEIVGLVKRRGSKEKWPGDSYDVLLRWPTVPLLTLVAGPEERAREAQRFIEKLCDGREIYVVQKSFNDRAAEAYYSLWCRPPKTV